MIIKSYSLKSILNTRIEFSIHWSKDAKASQNQLFTLQQLKIEPQKSLYTRKFSAVVFLFGQVTELISVFFRAPFISAFFPRFLFQTDPNHCPPADYAEHKFLFILSGKNFIFSLTENRFSLKKKFQRYCNVVPQFYNQFFCLNYKGKPPEKMKYAIGHQIQRYYKRLKKL